MASPASFRGRFGFPYASPSFYSQVYPDPDRGRLTAYWDLPKEYFGYLSDDGKVWEPEVQDEMKYQRGLKPERLLTEQQKVEVTQGLYLAQRVHPTQIYSALKAFTICLLMYGFWRKFGIRRPGTTLSFTLILYGIGRFLLEFLRDDNPFEYGPWMLYPGGTMAQNMALVLILIGMVLLLVSLAFKPLPPPMVRRK